MSKVRFHERVCPLLLPGHRFDFAEDVLSIEDGFRPDSIVFDLEDSVAEGNRENARNELEKLLERGSSYRKRFDAAYPEGLMIRINKPGSVWFDEDLRFIRGSVAPDYALISKVSDGGEVANLVELLGETTEVIPLIETLSAYHERDAILKALQPEGSFVVGYEDLSADLGIDRPERLDVPSPISHILNECLISASIHSRYVFDGISRRFQTPVDIASTKAEADYTKSIGARGKFAIHPSQVPAIKSAFDRSKVKDWAKDTVERYQAATRRGSASFVNESGHMEDTPSFRRAQKILKRWREQAKK